VITAKIAAILVLALVGALLNYSAAVVSQVYAAGDLQNQVNKLSHKYILEDKEFMGTL
jgi:hypothetical protein